MILYKIIQKIACSKKVRTACFSNKFSRLFELEISSKAFMDSGFAFFSVTRDSYSSNMKELLSVD